MKKTCQLGLLAAFAFLPACPQAVTNDTVDGTDTANANNDSGGDTDGLPDSETNTNDNTTTDTSDNANDNTNDPSNAPVSGTWDSTTGLTLESASVTLNVAADNTPSNDELTLEVLDATALVEMGLPADSGFNQGVAFGPDGTTFDTPADVTVRLSAPTPLTSLLVLRRDDETGEWVSTGITAKVDATGETATFRLLGFSSYAVWAPPLPTNVEAIGGAGIVAGTGSFSGIPFDPLPGTTTASLTFSPFGDVFGLSIINAGAQTGTSATSSAAFSATTLDESENVQIGYVTPGGGLSGPSLFNEGNVNYSLYGVMFLTTSDAGWTVDVYGAYEKGVVIGAASGS